MHLTEILHTPASRVTSTLLWFITRHLEQIALIFINAQLIIGIYNRCVLNIIIQGVISVQYLNEYAKYMTHKSFIWLVLPSLALLESVT